MHSFTLLGLYTLSISDQSVTLLNIDLQRGQNWWSVYGFISKDQSRIPLTEKCTKILQANCSYMVFVYRNVSATLHCKISNTLRLTTEPLTISGIHQRLYCILRRAQTSLLTWLWSFPSLSGEITVGIYIYNFLYSTYMTFKHKLLMFRRCS